MAIDTTEPAGSQPAQPGKGARGLGTNRTGRDRPRGSRFELWAWFFMRVSGLLLLVLAVGHVLIMHVLDDGIARVDFGFVALRWDQPFWRTWDAMLLVLALVHGVNGLRVVVLDYVSAPGKRLVMNWFFYVVGFALAILGLIVVFTFDATKWGPIPQ